LALWIEVYLNGSQYSDSYAAPFLIPSSSPNPSASYAASRFSFNQHRFSAVHAASRFSFSQSITLPLPLPQAVGRFLFPFLFHGWSANSSSPSSSTDDWKSLPSIVALRSVPARTDIAAWRPNDAASQREIADGRCGVQARRPVDGSAASSRCPSFLSTIDDVPRAFLGLFPFVPVPRFGTKFPERGTRHRSSFPVTKGQTQCRTSMGFGEGINRGKLSPSNAEKLLRTRDLVTQ
jgi:hypothetical protein